MSSSAEKIAFIGAGQMGMPMVQRLLAAGREVTVFARREEVRDEVAAAGARALADVREAVADADVVVVCLYADGQLRDLALGDRGFLQAMKPGALLVTHTTGSPGTVRVLADAGRERGVRVVDGPVSGSADDIAAGHVTVMLGGTPEDVEQASAVVAAYGDPVVPVGPLGGAQLVKLLNNALFAAQLQLAGEVERIAAGFGVDLAVLASTIQRSSGASYALGVVEGIGSAEKTAAVAGHFMRKDVDTIRAVADELDIELGVLGYVHDHGPLVFEARGE